MIFGSPSLSTLAGTSKREHLCARHYSKPVLRYSKSLSTMDYQSECHEITLLVRWLERTLHRHWVDGNSDILGTITVNVVPNDKLM